MTEQSSKKHNQNFQTFRDPAKSTDTGLTHKINPDESINQGFNTSLRYSNLATNEHLHSTQNHGPGIICPVHNEAGVYKCQICSKLRQVCPKYRNKNYSNSFKSQIFSEQENQLNIEMGKKFSFGNCNNTIITPDKKSNVITDKTERQRINLSYTDRPKTPQFSYYENRNNVFTHSLPNNIPRFQGSSTNLVQEFRLPGQSTYPSSHNISNTRIVKPGPRIIEEIVYVPVIKNVLVPQFINPETQLLTPRSRHQEKGQNSSQSPIRQHRYDQNVLMTPENLRKLAESIIR